MDKRQTRNKRGKGKPQRPPIYADPESQRGQLKRRQKAEEEELSSSLVDRFKSELRTTRHIVNSTSIVDGEVVVTYKKHPEIAQAMMIVFKKHWMQARTNGSKLALVKAYMEYDDVAGQDEYLKVNVLPLLPALELTKPPKAARTDLPIPTATELRTKGAISALHAAEHLRCDRRTIRNYFERGELTKTKAGLVFCDDKLNRKMRKKYGQAFRLK